MTQKKIVVKGVVQGVGFRPFCARTALGLGLCGNVRNTSAGVEIILEGLPSSIEKFIYELWENPPSAAVVSEIITEWERQIVSPNFFDFTILESRRDEKQQVFIPADIALCPDCKKEMFDKNDRRYLYPFINCTLCGPRYSIIEGLPYDRAKTTMKKFPMCPACEAEYHDPLNRRFHAQPNACPVCGPKIWITPPVPSGHPPLRGRHIDEITKRLARGKIVAIKGIGGFHIACIVNDDVVRELRRRKNRPAKPFAIMMRDIETAKKYLEISTQEEKLLTSPQAPIMICKTINPSFWNEVAPQQKNIGVMMPYTPLHHLIMQNFEMLVMTSANLSEAPIISQNDDAINGLASIVDAVLTHDRDIETAIDDSVILLARRNDKTQKIFLRRARGYVPNPINFAGAPVPIFAAGADIKSAFALSQNDVIFASQYLGDLRQLKTSEYYRRALRHFSSLYSITPQVFAHDAHPDYFSTKLGKICAQEFGIEKIKHIAVQHHAAHFAALLVENKTSAPAIGVIFDGIGYGKDGNIWGGEFLINDGLKKFERRGSIFPCKMPGGDKATEEPWRYALSMLESSVGEDEAKNFARTFWNKISPQKIDAVLRAKKFALHSTSCGRIFDGVSALLSICLESTFEGQAAMALEGMGCETDDEVSFEILDGELAVIDWRPAVREIVKKIYGGENISKISGAFHNGLAHAVLKMCELLRKKHGVSRVGLSGGVWQNVTLFEKTTKLLDGAGFEMLLHNLLSPNDENIAVGQVAIASAVL